MIRFLSNLIFSLNTVTIGPAFDDIKSMSSAGNGPKMALAAASNPLHQKHFTKSPELRSKRFTFDRVICCPHRKCVICQIIIMCFQMFFCVSAGRINGKQRQALHLLTRSPIELFSYFASMRICPKLLF